LSFVVGDVAGQLLNNAPVWMGPIDIGWIAVKHDVGVSPKARLEDRRAF
jgi:hypothetical protein